MKKKSTAVIGMMVVFCFMMMTAGAVWAGGTPNGTITDKSTGLVWLRNANCFDKQNWNQAMSSAQSLKSGACGLTDGSTAGQWRLPTKDELAAQQKNHQGCTNVQSNNFYWSSSIYARDTHVAWSVSDVYAGIVNKSFICYVWPVRAGNRLFDSLVL